MLLIARPLRRPRLHTSSFKKVFFAKENFFFFLTLFLSFFSLQSLRLGGSDRECEINRWYQQIMHLDYLITLQHPLSHSLPPSLPLSLSFYAPVRIDVKESKEEMSRRKNGKKVWADFFPREDNDLGSNPGKGWMSLEGCLDLPWPRGRHWSII